MLACIPKILSILFLRFAYPPCYEYEERVTAFNSLFEILNRPYLCDMEWIKITFNSLFEIQDYIVILMEKK